MALPKQLKTIVAIGMATFVIGALSACGTTDQTTYARMCENKADQTRVADSQCADTTANDDSYLWYYVIIANSANSNSNSYSAPAVGSRLSSGSTTEPSDGEEIDENLPEDGGEITGDEDGITEEQAPETDEDNSGTSVNDDENDDSGSSVSDDDDSESFSGGFSDDD